jgi:hypothetical protein
VPAPEVNSQIDAVLYVSTIRWIGLVCQSPLGERNLYLGLGRLRLPAKSGGPLMGWKVCVFNGSDESGATSGVFPCTRRSEGHGLRNVRTALAMFVKDALDQLDVPALPVRVFRVGTVRSGRQLLRNIRGLLKRHESAP